MLFSFTPPDIEPISFTMIKITRTAIAATTTVIIIGFALTDFFSGVPAFWAAGAGCGTGCHVCCGCAACCGCAGALS